MYSSDLIINWLSLIYIIKNGYFSISGWLHIVSNCPCLFFSTWHSIENVNRVFKILFMSFFGKRRLVVLLSIVAYCALNYRLKMLGGLLNTKLFIEILQVSFLTNGKKLTSPCIYLEL